MALNFASAPSYAFDQSHGDYAALLARHVRWVSDGHASVLDYAALRHDRSRLVAVLALFSAVRPGYRDPRAHFAVNCASVGCPALRPEPYVAAQLDQQLDDAQRRFLGDRNRNRNRNRFNATRGTLAVSPIFKWYKADFEQAARDLKSWLAREADVLAAGEADRARIRRGDFAVEFLDYDWSLNDVKR